MPDYDFLILQPNEFENLTRDLLQKREGVFVESFTPGRDGGIDLRFAKITDKYSAIVQAKRYKDYSSLKATLVKEVVKVKALNPQRYILSTSVGLTPKRKAAILALFSPFIQSTTDILGKDDLNNLLGLNPEVEKQYNKLWLGSTTVLEGILSKRIENWSAMELEEARRDISVYVMNESFERASSILKENRYLIISGIPGIGKTTLARMLAYDILAKGYEEFIKVASLDDAVEKLTSGRKQVFFYDDFLGSSFLEDKESGFENKVLSFIEKVKREPDKLFILSTREYILSAAKRRYEKLSLSNIELAKCTLDLSSYSEDIRAMILYNHLAMAELPIEYIKALLSGRQYLKLIRHDNFNPRIIEAFLKKKVYLTEPPQVFVNLFLDFFDRPYSVWEFAFGKMTKLAQQSLFVRATMGSGYVYMSDWKSAVASYLRVFNSNDALNQDEWNCVVKDLLGTFIMTELSKNDELVRFNNPSVYDFLMDYIRQRHWMYNGFIKSALFADQIIGTFTDRGIENKGYGRILLSEDNYPDLIVTFRRLSETVNNCKVSKYDNVTFRSYTNRPRFIAEMIDSFPVLFRNNTGILPALVNQELFENYRYPLRSRIRLLELLDVNACKIDLDSLIDSIVPTLDDSSDYVNSLILLEMTEKGHQMMAQSDFGDRVEDAIANDLESADSSYDIDEIRERIETLSEHISSFDKDEWESAADERSAQVGGPEERDYADWDINDMVESRSRRGISDYFDLYSSLLE